MDRHEYKASNGSPSSSYCIELHFSRGFYIGICGQPPSAECHSLLAEEETVGCLHGVSPSECLYCDPDSILTPKEADLVIGAIPLQALPARIFMQVDEAGLSPLQDERNTLAVQGAEREQLITGLVEALQRMRAEFYAHDCLNNIDCRRCKALDAADALLNPPLTQLPLEHVGLKVEREDSL